MNSAVPVWMLLLIVMVFSSLVGFASLLVFKMSADAIRAINQAHSNNKEYTEALIDRIVAGDYQTYKAYEMMERGPGNKKVDDEVPSEILVGDIRGGFGSRLGLAALSRSEELMQEELKREVDE